MKVNRKELLNILSLLKPGLSNKAIVEETTHFIFTGNDIVTYNDRIAISHLFDCDFKFTIMADEFVKILNQMKVDEFEMELRDSNLLMKAKGLKAKLVVGSVDSVSEYLKALDFGKERKWQKLPEDFIDAVKLSIFSAAKDASRPFLTCLNIGGDRIISAGDMRISIYEMKGKIKQKFLLPATSAIHLINFDVIEYCVEENWAYFITEDDVVFCSRIVNEDYPLEILEAFEFKGKIIEFPKEIIDAVCAAEIMAEGEFDVDKKIEVKISKGKVICKGSKEIGEIEAEQETDFKGELEFEINPIFFREILLKTNKVKIDDRRALFEIDNFKHLITIDFS